VLQKARALNGIDVCISLYSCYHALINLWIAVGPVNLNSSRSYRSFKLSELFYFYEVKCGFQGMESCPPNLVQIVKIVK
jgi:hypothetical protein